MINARLSTRNEIYTQFLYARLQRQGFLYRDAQRLVNNDRNVFAASMLATGDADAMVTGATRKTSLVLATSAGAVIDPKPGPSRDRRNAGVGARAHGAGCRYVAN